MFASSTANRDPSAPTTLTPGPDHWSTFRPETHNNPPQSLDKACGLAHQLGRAYLLWDERIYVVAGAHQWLATELTEADIVRAR